jgi:pyrroline-5-carboxylate reductase
MKITFIGAGNMAEAIVAGILNQKIIDPADLFVTDISEKRLFHFMMKYGVSTSDDNAYPASLSDVVILSVKPQVFPEIWPEIEEALNPDTLVVSIMAGVPSSKIANGKPIRVVRVMPNTPALIGEGAAGIAAGEFATKADLKMAETLMQAVGATVIVEEEELHAVTALSGSGPAYVFYLLEGMLKAAEQMGLEKSLARELALSTVIGAAKLMQETGEDADVLRKKVTSKGGTTAAALQTLDERGVNASIVEALLAAQTRSKELARG